MIIFGGYENDTLPLSPGNSLYVLDINSLSWSIPKVKVDGTIPSSRAFHKTVVIGKYMVVTFGKYKIN